MEEDHDFGQAVLDLFGLRTDAVTEDQAATEHGLDRWTEKPVYNLLERARGEHLNTLPPVDLVDRSRELSIEIGEALRAPHFPYKSEARERMRRKLVHDLIFNDGFQRDKALQTADELVNLATRNRERFLRFVR
jgi:type I restriction enzyme R subunit